MSHPLQDGDKYEDVIASKGGPIFTPAQDSPDLHRPPYTVTNSDDVSVTVHEVDIEKYGDCYDPQGRDRVYIEKSMVDTDDDGKV